MPNGGENGDPENTVINRSPLHRYSPEYVPGQHCHHSVFFIRDTAGFIRIAGIF